MTADQALRHPDLKKMVQGLQEALGPKLRSVVLYGSAARSEFHEKTSDLNLIAVLEDLEPATLQALTAVVGRWRGRGHHAPRLFTSRLIAESADVFPIEFLDIGATRVVLHGQDPFAGLEVRVHNLRLQCERELREKMMRLREGYVECHDRPRDLERLMTDSYTSFVALFRGCLRLLGGEIPARSGEVVTLFCQRAGLDRVPFEEVAALKRGETPNADRKAVFARYYEQLTRAVHTVDRFQHAQGGGTR